MRYLVLSDIHGNLEALDSVIDARLADAHDLVPKLTGPFDFVFIDADKGGYDAYYEGALQLLRPGGLVLVVDFSPHDLVELKREHAHVHLGFADNQVQGWLKSAGLAPLEPIHFPGRRLMTGIWRGEREAPARTAGRPAAAIQGASR